MKFRITLLLFAFFATMGMVAQTEVEKPDFEKFASEISDKGTDYYYPQLMKRYAGNDTTLSIDDYRHLYYGFSLQEDYNPYRVSPYAEKVKDFIEMPDGSGAKCDSIIKYATLAIEDFPFDTRSMNMLIYAFQCNNDEANRYLWTMKLKNIIDAILSSGDGDDKNSPYYVIYAPHEYEIINRFGLTAVQSVLIDVDTDFVSVEKNNFDVAGFYFNISKPMEMYRLKFEKY